MKDNTKRFLGILKERLLGAEINTSSGMVAYYTLLSVFPLLILVGSLLPYLGLRIEDVLPYIELLVPEMLQPALESLANQVLGGSSAGILSVSVVGLVWSASRGINYLQLGASRAYGLPHRKSFVVKRLFSVLTLLVISLALVALMLVFSFGDAVLEWLVPYIDGMQDISNFIRGIRWPATLIGCVVVLTLVYIIAPEARVPPRYALPGAALASLALVVLVRLMAVYLLFATRSFSSYGTLASLFIVMIWLNWSAKILLAGAVFNAALQQYREGSITARPDGLEAMVESRLRLRLKRWKGRLHRKKTPPGRDAGGENEV